MTEPKTYQCKFCAVEHIVGQVCTCKEVARLKGKTFICEFCKREWIKGQVCSCDMLKYVHRKDW
jgi:hypothetical protein